jgi:hypothetical protein
VGTTAQWLAVQATVGPEEAEQALHAAGAGAGRSGGDWYWARTKSFDPVIDGIIGELARMTGAAALGGWVADSDCAYLAFAAPGGELVARVSINQMEPFGERVAEIPDRWNDLHARNAAFRELATWAVAYAPAELDPEELARAMPGTPASRVPDVMRDGRPAPWASYGPWHDDPDLAGQWVFAEDAVILVFDRLGIDGPFAHI